MSEQLVTSLGEIYVPGTSQLYLGITAPFLYYNTQYESEKHVELVKHLSDTYGLEEKNIQRTKKPISDHWDYQQQASEYSFNPTEHRIIHLVSKDNNYLIAIKASFGGKHGYKTDCYYDLEIVGKLDQDKIMNTVFDDITTKFAISENKLKVPKVYYLMQNGNEIEFKAREFHGRNIDKDYLKFYNDDINDFTTDFLDYLQDSSISSGLSMLYGAPGTGKTTYLKNIIKQCTENDIKVLYVPPSMAAEMGNPKLITMLSNFKQAVLIVEDCENVLMKRKAGTNSGVYTLLNATDGILGDILQIKVIVTFNTAIENIDDALLRKGRLLHQYEFKALTSSKVIELRPNIKHLAKPMTLANLLAVPINTNKEESTSSKIGFKPATCAI